MPPPDLVLRERIARHALADRRCTSAVEATALTTAIQAQDTPASKLGLRARSAGITEADVTRAIEVDRTITRTWLMRGTIHLVATADLPWLTRLIGPAVARKHDKRWRDLGLTSDVRDRSLAAIPAILERRSLTRHEIIDALGERGIGIDTDEPYGPTHIIVHAATTGLICRGPDRGRNTTFALTDHWVADAPEGPSGDDAVAQLARRYFAAFSPATAADFGTWSGLAPVRSVDLIRDELTETDVYGRPGFRLGPVEPQRGLRLLPAFDNYLLGYKDRASIVDAGRYGDIYQGGMIHPAVLRDGRVVGRWYLDRAGGVITVRPYEPLAKKALREIEREVADVGRFLGLELTPVVTQVS